MSRLTGAVRHHPRIVASAGVAVVIVIAVVVVWFQPQKLVLDDSVDEAVPAGATASPPTSGTGGASPTTTGDAPPGDGELAGQLPSGDFRSLSHETTGRAQVLEADGKLLLRLEDLHTSNGPDLRVYLSAAEVGADGAEYARAFVDLGALKGNIGNQNYDIPADVDLARYKSVVIWCRRFSVAFGAAPLTVA